MKTLIRSLVFVALVATFSLPALPAATLAQTGGSTGQQQPDPAKTELYERFRTNVNGNQQVAYEAAREYMSKYGNDNDEYINYIKRWVVKYETALRNQKLAQSAQDIQQSKFADALTIAKQVLAEDPNNLTALWHASLAGLNLVTSGQSSESLNGEAIGYARHAIDLINQGATFLPNTPLSAEDRDKTLGLLNFALGIFNYKNAPADAIPYFIEVTKHNIPQKTEPQTYFLLATAYENAYYKRMAQEYQTKFPTVAAEQTPEGQLAKANLNEVINRIIDAYARAINLAGTNQKYAQQKPVWIQSVTSYYKFTHNDSDAGLNEMIASIQTKPLPPAFTPLTSLPAGTGTTSATGATPTASPTPAATPTPTPAQPARTGTTTTQPATRTNTNTNGTTQPSTNSNSNTGRPPSTTSSNNNSSRTTTNSRRPRR